MKDKTLGAIIGLLGFAGGGTSVWVTTVRRLDVHIARAEEKGALMCTLADYMATGMERVCQANGANCPRPMELKPDMLRARCGDTKDSTK